MRIRTLLVASLLLASVIPARSQAQISVGVDIGIHFPVYPRLVQVPGYPVYYDPRAETNYFFYDGAYWVFHADNWYVSSWYNGPWQIVGPEYVPLFVLRVPVRYYRRPPVYFQPWRHDHPPRWGERWGRDWEARRAGWDRWDRRRVPRPAPLPVYQRQYAGDRYPAPERQPAIRDERYRYRPRETYVREQWDRNRPERREQDRGDRGDRDRGRDKDRGDRGEHRGDRGDHDRGRR